MPLDIRSQVVTALDNINKNPELYTPPKPTTSLETRINDLKETNPRVAIYNSTKGNQLAHGYFFPKRSNERDLTNYVFLNNTGFNRSTMTHELNHKYVYDGQILPTELTSKQEKLITEAYPTRIETIPGSNTTIERRAVNEQLREEFVNEFYKRNGRYPEINSDRNELFEFLEKNAREGIWGDN